MNIPYNQFEQLYYESSVFKQSNLSVLHYCSSHNSMLKHLTFSYSDSYEKIIDIFLSKIHISHPFILQPTSYSYNTSIETINYPQMIEITKNIINIYCETPIFGRSLRIEVENRRKNYCYFTNYEIYYFIKESLTCFSYLQKNNIIHNSIKLDHFLINNGEFKLIDCLISVNLSTDFPILLGNKNFLSPFLKEKIKKNCDISLMTFYKNDVWGFGLCLLNMLSLFNIIGVNQDEIILKERIIDIEKKKNYEDWIIKIINLILQFDEEKCLDFITLQNILHENEKNEITLMKHYIEYMEKKVIFSKDNEAKLKNDNCLIQTINIIKKTDNSNRKITLDSYTHSDTSSHPIRKIFFNKKSVRSAKNKIKNVGSSIKLKKFEKTNKNNGKNSFNVINSQKKTELSPKIKDNISVNRNLGILIKFLNEMNFRDDEFNNIINLTKREENMNDKMLQYEIIGLIYQKKESYKESLNYIKTSLIFFKSFSSKNNSKLCYLYFHLGFNYFKINHFKESVNNFLNSLKNKIKNNSNFYIIINFWIAFSSLYLNKIDQSILYSNEVLHLLNEEEKEKKEIKKEAKISIYLILSISYYYKNNFQQSKYYLEHGIVLLENNKFNELSIYSYWFGLTESYLKNFKKSNEYLKKSYSLLLNIGKKNEILEKEIFYWIGYNYNERKKYNKAIAFHQKSFKLTQRIYGNNHFNTMDLFFWIAMDNFDLKLYEETISILKNIYEIKIIKFNPMHLEFAGIHYWKCKCYLELKNYEECYKEAKFCEQILVDNLYQIPLFLRLMISKLKEKLNI